MSIVEHLENHLGPIERRFTPTVEPASRGFQILSFDGSPFPDVVTVATLGLDRHSLPQRGGKDIHQELVMAAKPEDAAEIASVLHAVAAELLEKHVALPRGQVIGPRGPLVPGSSLEAIACLSPWYWPDSFASFQEGSRITVMVWLVPIYPAEAEFIRKAGVDAFEARISEIDPDLLDLRRAPIVS